MSTFTLSKQLDNHYLIDGDLTFSSINKKTMPSFDFLKQSNEIQIDLRNVASTDSAGLALLLEWIKHSKLYNTKLVFIYIPHQLLTLAALSGLDLNEYLTDID